MPPLRRASGCLVGLALGDALGAPVEFLSVAEILQRYPPHGPPEPTGDPARVTDDTQMTLAVGEALHEAARPLAAATLEGPLRRSFLAWYDSPDNDGAPGRTCLDACANLARGLPWYKATIAYSKGCGATMRVAPVGLLPPHKDRLTETTRAGIAQFQAALTHGHPTALAAADLTATAIADLAAGGDPDGLLDRLRVYAESQRATYHASWLGPLWERPGISTPEEFIARGWDECLTSLDRVRMALARPDRDVDPCLLTGNGWVAEEAFATGLLCFLMFPDDPVAVIRRAAVTGGDSDSISCLAGAFAGVHAGLSVWPQSWVRRLEYGQRLTTLGDGWDER